MLTRQYVDERSLALLRWAGGKLGDSRQAEELVQEVWAQALTALSRGSEPIRDMDRFLWTVAKYVWYRHLRAKTRYGGWASIDEDMPDGTDFVRELADADEARAQLRWVRDRIGRLSARQREIMLLHYLDGLTAREVAQRLHISEATVKWHLHDTRRKLKEESTTMHEHTFQYRPRRMHLGVNGQGVPQEDVVFISNSPVKQNLCIACYRTPRTLPQLAEYLGIPAGYLESDLRWLVEKEFMTETPQGFSTTFLIATNQEKQARYAVHKAHRAALADAVVDGLLAAEPIIRDIGFHGCDQPMDKLLWLLIYRFYNHLPLAPMMPPPFRPDGGRYWPLGFDTTEEPNAEIAVNTDGWAYNGSMHNDNFRWFGLYNFGNTEIEDLMMAYTPAWKQLHDTLCILIHSDFDTALFNDQQQLDVARLAEKGFVTVDGSRAIPNFCVFTEAQEKRLVEEVFLPLIDRVKPAAQTLCDELRGLVREQLPKQLRHLEDQALFQAAFDACYLTYIFAFGDGRLYVPKDKEDGMFLTMTYLRRKTQ